MFFGLPCFSPKSKTHIPYWSLYPFSLSLFKDLPEVAAVPPPTLSSGFGVLPDVAGGDAVKVTNKHEATVREWLHRCSTDDVIAQMKKAKGHTYYVEFAKTLNRSFGSLEDLVEFEAWLAKKILSDRMPPPANPPKSDKTKPKQKQDDLPELSPQEKEAYQEYWKKYHASPTSDVHTPNGSSDPSEVEATPECKKRLRMDEAGLFIFVCMFQVFVLPVFNMLMASPART